MLLPCPGYYKQCCDEHWGTRVSFNSDKTSRNFEVLKVSWLFMIPLDGTWDYANKETHGGPPNRVRLGTGNARKINCILEDWGFMPHISLIHPPSFPNI